MGPEADARGQWQTCRPLVPRLEGAAGGFGQLGRATERDLGGREEAVELRHKDGARFGFTERLGPLGNAPIAGQGYGREASYVSREQAAQLNVCVEDGGSVEGVRKELADKGLIHRRSDAERVAPTIGRKVNVLGREAGCYDEAAAARILAEAVGEAERGVAQQRVDAPEVGGVAREAEMLVERGAESGCGGR